MTLHAKRISRADLLRALADRNDGGLLEVTAQLSGFKPPPKKIVSLKLPALPVGGGTNKTPDRRSSPSPEVVDKKPHYYRLIERKQSEILPESVEGQSKPGPVWLKEADDFDPDGVVPLPVTPPEKEPLVAWARLWPVLRNLLSEQVQTRKPDIPEIVRIVANGHWLEHIPRTRRQRWLSHVQVLLDRPERTSLFNQDYNRLLVQLKQMRGTTGLVFQRWMRQPGGRVRVENGKGDDIRDWQVPVAGTTVFILSDLGLLDTSGIARRAWIRVGKQLRLAGCRAVVLLPLPERYLVPEIVALFECISWDRSSALQQTLYVLPEEDTEQDALLADGQAAEDLLAWLSPAVRVEPALLRAVRHQLPVQDFDVGKEVAAWHHEDVERSRIGFHFQPQPAIIEKYSKRLEVLCEDYPERAKAIAELILRYHQHVFPTQRYEEMLQLAALLGDDCPISPEELEQAKQHMRQLVKAGWQRADQLAGIQPFLMHLIERQPLKVGAAHDFYQVVWGVKRSELGELAGTTLPEGFDPVNVLVLVDMPQGDTREYVLFQEGLRALQLSSRARFVRGDTEGWVTGSQLASFKTATGLMLKAHQQLDGEMSHQLLALDDDETLALPLEEGEIQRVHVPGQELVIERFVKPLWALTIAYDENGALYADSQNLKGEVFRWYWHPPAWNPEQGVLRGFWFHEPDNSFHRTLWADSTGTDQHGLYADTQIAGIPQRFRWIEPTTFLMGSSEGEAGRSDDETQHPVTLSQGYWLADTACTQQLWQAAMSENPSDFKDENNPVENVSWDDIQEFLERINNQHPELKLRLPSEAEWENACRAGTTSAFHFGEKDDLSLERVNYSGKWDKHNADGQTKPVKSYPPNAWGLYEMHGNVEEWCQDWYSQYPKKIATDPVGPDTGVDRVLRGGSWIDRGGFCRSASRFRLRPVDRNSVYGFRLALGHASPSVRTVGAGQQRTGNQLTREAGGQAGADRRPGSLTPPGV